MFAVLRRRGVDVDRLLRRARLSESALLEPLHRLPREEVVRLVRELALIRDTEALGLEAADELNGHDFDLLGHLLATAPTAGAALAQAQRYMSVVHDGVELEIAHEGKQIRLIHRITGSRVQLPIAVDYAVGMIFRLFREIAGGAVPLLGVKLARPRPKHPKRYRQWFGAPVTFNAQVNELRLAADALHRALPKANASLHAVLERQAVATLAALPRPGAQPGFVERVRRELSRGIDRGAISASDIARATRIGQRTLRRRLRELGTSYRALLDDVRRERALALAQDPLFNVSQIAHLLGYTGPTSFGRAFRRWTGMVPREYARRARSA